MAKALWDRPWTFSQRRIPHRRAMASGVPQVRNILHGIVLRLLLFKISGSVWGSWWVFKSEGKIKGWFPSIFPRIFVYHLLIKSVVKVEMEMHFSTRSYTHLPQSKAPTSHTILIELLRLLPPGKTWPSAGHAHLRGWTSSPPSSALRISEEGILTGTVNPSPWILLAFSSAPASSPVSFLPIFEKPLRRHVSAHWWSLLTSHSVLNPQQ